MSKRIVIVILILVFVFMLIPKVDKMFDGGSKQYNALLYSVTKYHKISKNSSGYDEGLKIEILGMTIYDKIFSNEEISEHIISIISVNKQVDALTGSFCYESICVDKADLLDAKYDTITSYFNNKLYIDNLDGIINSIELYDYELKKMVDYKIEYTDEYIITPKIDGLYIFKIDALYNGKIINYYFMCKINKTSGEEFNIKFELKKDTLTNTGLTLIMKNNSNKDVSYGNPYSIEKYDNGKWKTLNTINNIYFTMPAYSLNKKSSVEINIDWSYGYGNLSGKYRIVKGFNYKEYSFNKYLEFEI